MKKNFTLLSLVFLSLFFSITLNAQVSITPNPFQINESITITVDINSTASNCNSMSNPNKVYMHSGIGDDTNPFGFKVVGNYEQDDGIGQMTNNGNGIYSITIVPENYYGLTTTQASNATKIGMVIRNENGRQELKGNNCSDFIFDVGLFQANLTNPSDAITILNSGQNLSISASNTNGNATYTLKANGIAIDSSSGSSTYSYTDANITTNKNYVLEITQLGTSISKLFSVIINPGTTIQNFPTAGLEDGINYNDNDPTKAILVLNAPLKDFVYVAGSFNNWQPDDAYAMKKDSSGKFWLELNGLTPNQVETYQFWVTDQTPVANSPKLVKTADPYSTLVLSPFDDPYIPASSYPNLPAYPAGQEREVSVLETGKTPYNWQVTDFSKPKKEDLIIYEVLIRDFDTDRNIQDLIDKIDYFKNLNINAIQLMPIMEFEGNESWGYNTSFHMALDKFYGTEEKFKEFIDLCHQNGIAVILDVALNHAFGRNPLVRMWMNDPDVDGWGEPSNENPFLNQEARHSYSVGYDFDHSSALTKYYTKRVLEHWIKEFKIDGFRWDLTKGFTQLCNSNDDPCTNGTPSDRFGILTEYADYSWSLDPTHYVIFEHLGSNSEEKPWADYRFTGEVDGIAKGIMLWGKMTDPYTELSKGFAAQGNLAGVGHKSRNFNAKRLVGYAESHDEERVMYRTQTEGNTALQNARLLPSALIRASSVAATLITVPGPKMIWHFGALGMNNSIFTCKNGKVNLPGDVDGQGDCKLDTKPQPQWTENWTNVANRSQVYKDYARLNALKVNEPVFEGDYTISPNGSNIRQRIYVFNDALPNTALKNVVVLANFSVGDLTIVPDFPYTGSWFDLMDETGNTVITVTNTAAPITIPAGQFRIFGNQAATLSSTSFNAENSFTIYPNPVNDTFRINKDFNVLDIYDITGKLIRSFKGAFTTSDNFDVSDLDQSMYVVKIAHSNGQVSTSKLIKM
ncbi:putative secreted protein (Por secretion system target) [Gelidibacter algens]|uniref:Putative secreted protein (Por secretion system target) n=1 Tax=Gelidibacter algens TaxID=49280 RepID=A0A1A7R4H2_9FLAO|nr:alpha-amylase family glycosyl hydrolase [Gelidibacter algens]OBX26751.1 alpha-amylase [Gelidibacter algens]RAJ22804.1 putative secreted protein (Por secretion system target) [Gelidibacter algens]